MAKLERKGNPMEKVMMAYAVYFRLDIYYPHGGAGWLFSNAAVRKFAEHIDLYYDLCQDLEGDDVALGAFFIAIGLKVLDYASDRFILAWPFPHSRRSRRTNYGRMKLKPCRKYSVKPGGPLFKPAVIHQAAAIHMHYIRMDLVHGSLRRVKSDVAVRYRSRIDLRGGRGIFCRINNETKKRKERKRKRLS
jgi:hypothetical protein